MDADGCEFTLMYVTAGRNVVVRGGQPRSAIVVGVGLFMSESLGRSHAARLYNCSKQVM